MGGGGMILGHTGLGGGGEGGIAFFTTATLAAMTGADSTVTPSSADAAPASPMAARTLPVAVVAAAALATAMTASMLTEAAVTMSSTAEGATLAVVARALFTLLDAAEPSA